jgi:hypothetical protein
VSELNQQQKNFLELLDVARKDVEAGRPAERAAHALWQALDVARYTDMTDGLADDQRWRITRIPTALEPRVGVDA